jgi:hypothetical protein
VLPVQEPAPHLRPYLGEKVGRRCDESASLN